MANEATAIYLQCGRDCLDDETRALVDAGINPIWFDGIEVSVSSEDSMAINADPVPKVIISASGMCEAGRIRHHLKHNLWRQESTVLFVGYQTEGTLGRILLDGASTVKLFGEEIRVRAKIVKMEGISGHADRGMLLSWLDGFEGKPRFVFVNHGTDALCDAFARTIEQRFGIPARAPYNGAVYDTEREAFTSEGNRSPIGKKPAGDRKSAMFDKLTAALQKLTDIAARCRNGSAKDISKLTDQILALCSKWDKK